MGKLISRLLFNEELQKGDLYDDEYKYPIKREGKEEDDEVPISYQKHNQY